jgi:AraC-like DNA-binding protein
MLLWDYLEQGFARGILKIEGTGFFPEWIQAAAQLISQECLSKNFKLKNLAERLGVSLSHLQHEFHRYYRTSPGLRLRNMRLDNATRMLRCNPELGIGEIALHCGFSSLPAFDRAFARRFGCRPLEFRNAARKRAPKG